MKVSIDDYVIVKTKTEKGSSNHLVKVGSVDGKSFSATLEKFVHIPGKKTQGEFEISSIVANLGNEPSPGKCYGADVTNIYRGKKVHKDFGDIAFFYKPNKQVREDLMEAFDKAAKILNKWGLSFLIGEIIWEIVPFTNEKYAGMYYPAKIKNKDAPSIGDIPARIQIRPEIMPSTYYVYVIMHEIGHHLHKCYMQSKKLNALWIRLYNTSIRMESIRKDKSKELLGTLLEGEESPSNFKSTLSEEDTLAYKWILKTIQSISGVSVKQLDILFEAGMKEDIEKLWPIRNIPRKELAPVVTEYATKSYEELLAESYAFHLTKQTLPEGIIKLVEKSISYAKTQAEK